MLNFLRGFLLDVFAAFMFAILAVLAVGVVFVINTAWAAFVDWLRGSK